MVDSVAIAVPAGVAVLVPAITFTFALRLSRNQHRRQAQHDAYLDVAMGTKRILITSGQIVADEPVPEGTAAELLNWTGAIRSETLAALYCSKHVQRLSREAMAAAQSAIDEPDRQAADAKLTEANDLMWQLLGQMRTELEKL